MCIRGAAVPIGTFQRNRLNWRSWSVGEPEPVRFWCVIVCGAFSATTSITIPVRSPIAWWTARFGQSFATVKGNASSGEGDWVPGHATTLSRRGFLRARVRKRGRTRTELERIPDVIIESVKRVDLAVYRSLMAMHDGSWQGGILSLFKQA